MTGIYVILIALDKPNLILIGKKRCLFFQNGFYGYVGSALSGLQRRLERHLSSKNKLYWHIDYLLNTAKIRNIICSETHERKECSVAQTLSQKLLSIADFGCSDCKCQSHLFFCQDLKSLEVFVLNAFKSLGLNPFLYVKPDLAVTTKMKS